MDVSVLLRKFNDRRAKKSNIYRSSALTEEKRLRYWLAPLSGSCQSGKLYHDKLTHSKNKHYLATHPYSKDRISTCPVPSSVKYSPDWFVKMKLPIPPVDALLSQMEEPVVGDTRTIGGDTGVDVSVGRASIDCALSDYLRTRYTTAKHGIPMSKRAIASKAVTDNHRVSLRTVCSGDGAPPPGEIDLSGSGN